MVERSIADTAVEFGGLDVVVNCAGIVHVGPLHEYDEAQWDQLMGVNVKLSTSPRPAALSVRL